MLQGRGNGFGDRWVRSCAGFDDGVTVGVGVDGRGWDQYTRINSLLVMFAIYLPVSAGK